MKLRRFIIPSASESRSGAVMSRVNNVGLEVVIGKCLLSANSGHYLSNGVRVLELASGSPVGYVRTVTDFTATLGGETLSFTRRYDSLAAFDSGSFGAGSTLVWRDLRLDPDVPLTGAEASGVYSPLSAGSRVIVETPDGGRAAFTFAPEQVTGDGFSYFLPRWLPDPGVTWQLESASLPLQRAAGRFYALDDGSPYNPASLAGTAAQYTLVAVPVNPSTSVAVATSW